MTISRNDSGPAFPYEFKYGGRCEGMSLRQYYAAQALPAIIAQVLGPGGFDGIDGTSARVIAVQATEIADAMLEVCK